MPRAYNFLRVTLPSGRQQAIERGLTRAGWSVIKGAPPSEMQLTQQDLVVVWCRQSPGPRELACRAGEMAGGRALICEEAQIKAGAHGEKLFSLCLDDHHGGGDWPVGGPERWASFGIELAPWRTGGDKVVVCEQRGIGSKRLGSPKNWHEIAAQRLTKAGYQVEIRRHSKILERRGIKVVPLEKQIADAHALVTWSSSVAVSSVIAGCPTIVCAPATFLPGCVGRRLEDLVDPPTGDRLPALERLAWCQWTLAEVQAGVPFKRFRDYLA